MTTRRATTTPKPSTLHDRQVQIDPMLDRLKTLSDDHFNTSPTRSIGVMSHLNHYAGSCARSPTARFKEASMPLDLRPAPPDRTGMPSPRVEAERLAACETPSPCCARSPIWNATTKRRDPWRRMQRPQRSAVAHHSLSCHSRPVRGNPP